MFLKAGINHVIWVGREFKIQDETCVKFAKTFYKQLFQGGSKTVWDAFEIAKSLTKTQIGKDINQSKD